MKLPPFEKFMNDMVDGKLDFEDYSYRAVLPENPKPDDVAEFARVTAHFTTLNLLRKYHSWLSVQSTTSE